MIVRFDTMTYKISCEDFFSCVLTSSRDNLFTVMVKIDRSVRLACQGIFITCIQHYFVVLSYIFNYINIFYNAVRGYTSNKNKQVKTVHLVTGIL